MPKLLPESRPGDQEGPQAACAFTMGTPTCVYIWGAGVLLLQRSKQTPDTPSHPT